MFSRLEVSKKVMNKLGIRDEVSPGRCEFGLFWDPIVGVAAVCVSKLVAHNNFTRRSSVFDSTFQNIDSKYGIHEIARKPWKAVPRGTQSTVNPLGVGATKNWRDFKPQKLLLVGGFKIQLLSNCSTNGYYILTNSCILKLPTSSSFRGSKSRQENLENLKKCEFDIMWGWVGTHY